MKVVFVLFVFVCGMVTSYPWDYSYPPPPPQSSGGNDDNNPYDPFGYHPPPNYYPPPPPPPEKYSNSYGRNRYGDPIVVKEKHRTYNKITGYRKPEDVGKKVGRVLSQVPSLLKATSNWLNKLSAVGMDFDRSISRNIKKGADVISDFHEKIPEDLPSVVEKNLVEGLNDVEDIKNEIDSEVKQLLNETYVTESPDIYRQIKRESKGLIGLLGEFVESWMPIVTAIDSSNNNTTDSTNGDQ